MILDSRFNLLRTLISMRLDDCDSMESYVNHVVKTAQKLRGTGFNIDEEWIGSLLLAGLPEKFSPMIMAIEYSGIAITTDCIKTKFMDIQTGKVVLLLVRIVNPIKTHRLTALQNDRIGK